VTRTSLANQSGIKKNPSLRSDASKHIWLSALLCVVATVREIFAMDSRRYVHIRRYCAACALVVLCVASLSAQGNITVILREPPPNQLKVADLWEITLINNGRIPINVSLRGTVTEAKDGLIATATSSTFALRPGTKVFTAKNVNELSPVNTSFKNPRYEDILTAIGSAPSGTYDICIEVRSSGLEASVLATSCVNSHTVESTSQPLLLSPQDGGNVEDVRPIFTWAMPMPSRAGGGVSYSIRIVQLLGKQSPVGAIQTNPSWLELSDVKTTTILYPPGARPLVAGGEYAWKVSAFVRGALLGESEVWRFGYSPSALVIEAPPPGSAKKKNLTLNVLSELLQGCNDESGIQIYQKIPKK
jgi:hypothetical protein